MNVMFVGMSPSSRTTPTKNSTLTRLNGWCDRLGLESYDFHNVIPNVTNGSKMEEVDVDMLLQRVRGRKKVIALGGFVSRVLTKYKIEHHKADHPSPRNRNFNDPAYEPMMLDRLKAYIHEH